VTFTVGDLELVAQRAAELVRDEVAALLETHKGVTAGLVLVDVATVATTLAVSQKWVRAHAREIGGRQIAGRWRFDLSLALAAESQPAPLAVRRPRLTRPLSQSSVPLLPIRGAVDGR
jgi:hypothetical protein